MSFYWPESFIGQIALFMAVVILIWGLVVALAPMLGAYPVFVLKVLCFALFACAFNLLIGYTGLLSFGHAAFFGGAGYFAWENVIDLSKYAKMSGSAIAKELAAEKSKVLEKWVD